MKFNQIQKILILVFTVSSLALILASYAHEGVYIVDNGKIIYETAIPLIVSITCLVAIRLYKDQPDNANEHTTYTISRTRKEKN
tara:strand:+ start:558 stop:809 length:252 start_codon:yes stop_codon:yes gene_type:complete